MCTPSVLPHSGLHTRFSTPQTKDPADQLGPFNEAGVLLYVAELESLLSASWVSAFLTGGASRGSDSGGVLIPSASSKDISWFRLVFAEGMRCKPSSPSFSSGKGQVVINSGISHSLGTLPRCGETSTAVAALVVPRLEPPITELKPPILLQKFQTNGRLATSNAVELSLTYQKVHKVPKG